MDLNGVNTFVQVVESGSFTRAADELGLPKSSVSRSVAELERSLGVRLLQRTTRKIHLTDAGRIYFDKSKAALAEIEEANARVSELTTVLRGIVRVTVPPDLAGQLLARIIADYSLEHPEVVIDVRVSSHRVDLVQEGIDLAVRAGELRDSSLVARKVGTTDLGLYASTAYLERKGRPESLADLRDHDCVLYREPLPQAKWVLTGPAGKESVSVSGPVRADDLVFVHAAVAAGAGIGLLPSVHCRAPLEQILTDYAVRGSPLHIVSPSTRHATAVVSSFRDHLVERLSGLSWKREKGVGD
jgi:DNA-binding transcriptional LysR family regulator